jgi:hypothetical protein
MANAMSSGNAPLSAYGYERLFLAADHPPAPGCKVDMAFGAADIDF